MSSSSAPALRGVPEPGPATVPTAAAPETRGRVLVVLPRGEAIRNFVYSGALDELSASADVRVLSVVPSEDYRRSIESRYGELLELSDRADPWRVRITREILELAHGRFLWSAAARQRWRLRDREAASPRAWVKRRAKKLAALPFANRTGLALLSGLESRASRGTASTRYYRELLKAWRPTLVFNGSHSHSAVATDAVHAAQSLGIPTAAFLFSWDNLTSQGRIMPPYDSYLVWNESIRAELLRQYPATLPESVFVTGTPQFDFHFRPETHWSRREFCERVGADPARPIVLYTTGTPGLMPGEPELVEGIAGRLRTMGSTATTAAGRPQLLVRVYGKDLSGRFEPFRRRNPDVLVPAVAWNPRWYTPEPGDAAMLTNSLRHAAVGINVASTISLELAMFDKPVINVGYNPPGVDPKLLPVDFLRFYEYEHYRPVTESGAIDLVRSEDELERAVRDALAHPERRAEARKKLTERFFGDQLDGRSSSRVAACLAGLASEVAS